MSRPRFGDLSKQKSLRSSVLPFASHAQHYAHKEKFAAWAKESEVFEYGVQTGASDIEAGPVINNIDPDIQIEGR